MAGHNGNEPAMRADLQAVGHDLHADTQTFEERLTQVLTRSQAEILEKTHGFIRDRQTELLRRFDAFSTAFHVRIRKLQADVSNIDAAADQRLTLIERRMLEIERRWQIPPPEL
jgi:hypothetical protein